MPQQSAAWRDHLANERTYLAWLRSALGVLVLGLAIAKFGGGGGLVAGIVLSTVAVAGLAFSAVRYRQVRHAIMIGDLPTGSGLAPVVAGGVLVLALIVSFIVLQGT